MRYNFSDKFAVQETERSVRVTPTPDANDRCRHSFRHSDTFTANYTEECIAVCMPQDNTVRTIQAPVLL